MDYRTLEKHINFLLDLADGINPITKEKCKDGEVLCHPDVIRMLFKLAKDLQEEQNILDISYELQYYGEDEISEGDIITILESNDIDEIKEKLYELKTDSHSPLIEFNALTGAGNVRIVMKTSYEDEYRYNWIPIKKPVPDKRNFKIVYSFLKKRKGEMVKIFQTLSSSQIVDNVLPEDLTSQEAITIAQNIIKTLSDEYEFEKIEVL